AEFWHSCLDCGGHRIDDSRRNDARHAWPYRRAAACRLCDAAHLRVDLRLCDFANYRRIYRLAQSDRRRRRLLALRLRAVRAGLRTLVDLSQAGRGEHVLSPKLVCGGFDIRFSIAASPRAKM